jgi:hypothetical protein
MRTTMADHHDLEIPPFLDRRPRRAKIVPVANTEDGGLSTTSSTSLPELIERASARLIQAKSSAEVLEAKGLAEMALHYARVTEAANQTQADCLRIVMRAEIRMANGVDAAQECGQLPRRGGYKSKVRTADFAEVGLDKRRVNEWRAVRDAGEQFVEDVLREALAEERTPTKREIVDGAKAVCHELKARAARPHVAKGEEKRRSSVRRRATRAGQSNRLIRVHWWLDATSATIVRALLAKLAAHPQHLALCAVLRTFLTEQVIR